MTPTLSILIPTVESDRPSKDRREFLAALMEVLEPQLSGRVKAVSFADDGKLPIGAKRQRMIEESDTPFVAFVDDDDKVPPSYCKSILKAVDAGADVVGFRQRYYVDGALLGLATISLKAERWTSTPHADGLTRYSRTPNHLSPIRRELALAIGYKSKNSGEDADYSDRLYAKFGATMREVFVDEYLYDYFYRNRMIDPLVMYDEDGCLTRAGMEAVIKGGGTVSLSGRLCMTLEQLDG